MVLIVATAVAGYALLRFIPESLLQLLIGTLLLIFGLQWLRKAILRSAGRKALHDEAAIYAAEAAAGRAAAARSFLGLDWFAFVVSFKGVLLEGLEVVFIVLTFGLSAGDLPLAALGALLAVVPVAILAFLVRGPAVTGAREPHQDRRRAAAQHVRDVLVDRGAGPVRGRPGESRVAVRRRQSGHHPGRLDRDRPDPHRAAARSRRGRGAGRRGRRGVRFVEAFLRFWYEFIVGDDWRIAAGVVAVLGVGAIVVGSGVTWTGLAVGLFVALVVVFALPMVVGARRPGR